MRHVVLALAVAGLLACSQQEGALHEEATTETASFEGADYVTEDEKLTHGERVARLMGCTGCHGPFLTGVDFGAMIPLLEGLWATNISLTMPEMNDGELERLLREGVHPEREIYLMPSKQSQFLSDRDMAALIAWLRSMPPAGDPTPLPPDDFEEKVTAQLPEDYWAKQLEDPRFHYHNSAEEAEYFLDNQPPELGEDHALGRYVAVTICSGCHGAGLDGVGEPAGSLAAAENYDEDALRRLLLDGTLRSGEIIDSPWGTGPGHVTDILNEREKMAAGAYARALAEQWSKSEEH